MKSKHLFLNRKTLKMENKSDFFSIFPGVSQTFKNKTICQSSLQHGLFTGTGIKQKSMVCTFVCTCDKKNNGLLTVFLARTLYSRNFIF